MGIGGDHWDVTGKHGTSSRPVARVRSMQTGQVPGSTAMVCVRPGAGPMHDRLIPVQAGLVPVRTLPVTVPSQRVPEQSHRVPVRSVAVPVQSLHVPEPGLPVPVQGRDVPGRSAHVPVQSGLVPVQSRRVREPGPWVPEPGGLVPFFDRSAPGRCAAASVPGSQAVLPADLHRLGRLRVRANTIGMSGRSIPLRQTLPDPRVRRGRPAPLVAGSHTKVPSPGFRSTVFK